MSSRQTDQAPAPTARNSGPWLRRAWVSVALVPVFFIIAFAVGESVYAVLGYKPENADAPAWAIVVATALILLVVLIPCVAAAYFGRRAISGGDRRGLLPAVIGAIAAVGWAALTIVSEVGDAVRR